MFLFSSCYPPRHCFHQVKQTLTRNSKLKKTTQRNFFRQISHESEAPKFVPFLDMLDARTVESRKSILVQVQSAQSFRELHSYCNSIGAVKQMLHYTVGLEPKNFIIVEFENESDVKNILSASSHVEDPHVVPIHSNFLWFRATEKKLSKLKLDKNIKLAIENGTEMMKDVQIKEILLKCDNMSDQITALYNNTKLNDVETRLRFLTASQIENALMGMFPNVRAFPFGSSVNGCGKMGCDLDLVLRLSNHKVKNETRLVFHCKERNMSPRNMEVLGDLINLFMPGCAQVRRILQARVPIIKYYQELTNVECDLSMSNMSGVHMSDFLYIMGAIDDRVRPLIFAVRKWAKEVGVTNSSPGRWVTNFSLTLLVIAFLQKPLYSPPVLPSLNTLVKLSDPCDKHVTEEGLNCTFLRNIEKYTHPTENKETMESLLREFFEFYSQFDFKTQAICLNESVAIIKPEHCAMYIVNPLERGLNVSRNVSLEELDRFQDELRNAAWMLESQENNSENWGLLSICENKKKTMSMRHGRLMEVSTLFENDPSTPVEYKNGSVKKQVTSIKKQHQNDLKKLQKLHR